MNNELEREEGLVRTKGGWINTWPLLRCPFFLWVAGEYGDPFRNQPKCPRMYVCVYVWLWDQCFYKSRDNNVVAICVWSFMLGGPHICLTQSLTKGGCSTWEGKGEWEDDAQWEKFTS